MRVFNSFADLFNVSCLSASAYFGSRIIDEDPVELNNGIADISEFLEIANANNPGERTKNSEISTSRLFVAHEVTLRKLKNEYADVFPVLQEEVFELAKNVLSEKELRGLSIKTMDGVVGVLRSIQGKLNKIKEPSLNEDNYEKLKYRFDHKDEYSQQLKEFFKDVELFSAQVKDIWWEFTGALFENPLLVKQMIGDIQKKILFATSEDDYTLIMRDFLNTVLEQDSNGNYCLRFKYKKLGVKDYGDIMYANNPDKSVVKGKVEAMLKKVETAAKELGKLHEALNLRGFDWSPEKQWYNHDKKYPVEIVVCGNMLFGDELGKALIHLEPSSTQLKYDSMLLLNDLFNSSARRHGFIEQGVASSNTKEIIRDCWDFIMKGDTDYLHYVMRLHAKTITDEQRKDYPSITTDDDAAFVAEDEYIKKAMDKDENRNKKWYEVVTGVSEVDRFIKLLEACDAGLYVPLNT